MRINKFVAQASGLSRRAADQAIADGRVQVNGTAPHAGQSIADDDQVALDGILLTHTVPSQTVILNKPVGYVVSRTGQGSKTIYDLLPPELHHLKPVGRLDKMSSGLLVLTNDGALAHQLTHPSFQKDKVYEVTLSRPLRPDDMRAITTQGIPLDDGISKFALEPIDSGTTWRATLHQGRNRQIRRTFAALGYTVTKLHRTQFGPYTLTPNHKPGTFSLEKHR